MGSLALAALVMVVVLLASMVSVRAGLSVAILELIGGVVIGNAFGARPQPWLMFVAGFAGVVLTFLAGAEVDVDLLRREWRAPLAMGLVSFAAPFVVAMATAHWLLGWTGQASAIAGIALSDTSIAVAYAVLVESGLNQARLGKLLMSATFVTGLATATALSVIFVRPNPWFIAFLVASVGCIVGLPRVAPAFFRRYGDRVIEPEIKLVFAILLVLMWLGDRSGGHAVLPAFVLGLMMATHYRAHARELQRLRVAAFAFLTPLFFVRGGMAVSLGAVWTSLGALAVLMASKLVPKIAGVHPLSRRTLTGSGEAWFGTLLMSTGLTFGTIAALYGLNAGIVDRTQFSLLMAVVVGSAVIPTIVAQRWFIPRTTPSRDVAPRQTAAEPGVGVTSEAAP